MDAFLQVLIGLVFAHHVFCVCPGGIPCTCASTSYGNYIRCSGRGLYFIPNLEQMAKNMQAYDKSRFVDKLDLSNNKIQHLPNRWLGNIEAKEVVLDRNPLHKVNTRAFQGANSLIALSANGCKLTLVPPIFQNVNYLKSLSLHSNEIRTIARNTFKFAQKLEYLDLSRNPLVFTDGMFFGLCSLESIRLEELGLTDIPRKALSPLRKLNDLILDFNHIENLNGTSFAGLPQLNGSYYRFAKNGMTRIALDTFKDHAKPFHLVLDANKISSLDFLSGSPCAYEGSDISLLENPIQCDCKLFDKMKYHAFTLLATCASPERYAGSDLHHVPNLDGTIFAGRPYLTAAAEECKDLLPGRRFDCKCGAWLAYAEYNSKRGHCWINNRGTYHKIENVLYSVCLLIFAITIG